MRLNKPCNPCLNEYGQSGGLMSEDWSLCLLKCFLPDQKKTLWIHHKKFNPRSQVNWDYVPRIASELQYLQGTVDLFPSGWSSGLETGGSVGPLGPWYRGRMPLRSSPSLQKAQLALWPKPRPLRVLKDPQGLFLTAINQPPSHKIFIYGISGKLLSVAVNPSRSGIASLIDAGVRRPS